MPFQYKSLPYESDALEPHISEKTMTLHHDKHYKRYVDTLNKLTAKSKTADESLEEIMMKSGNSDSSIFQNAAQAWNHEFYWKCLSPEKTRPSSNEDWKNSTPGL